MKTLTRLAAPLVIFGLAIGCEIAEPIEEEELGAEDGDASWARPRPGTPPAITAPVEKIRYLGNLIYEVELKGYGEIRVTAASSTEDCYFSTLETEQAEGDFVATMTLYGAGVAKDCSYRLVD